MYQIVFYTDKNKKSEVYECIQNLKSKNNSKDSRIKYNKIIAYINQLSKNGLSIGEPFIKHIDDEIWELRPLRDRMLFASWNNNKFIILSVYMKQTQKHRKKKLIEQKDYWKSIEKGEKKMDKELTWEEVKKSLNLTPEEKAEIQLEEDLIEATIEARKKNNLSQRKLSEISGIKQPAIARIEKGMRSPQANTLIRLLYPMGYTIRVVPLNKKNK